MECDKKILIRKKNTKQLIHLHRNYHPHPLYKYPNLKPLASFIKNKIKKELS
jgi:hypothetical protein